MARHYAVLALVFIVFIGATQVQVCRCSGRRKGKDVSGTSGRNLNRGKVDGERSNAVGKPSKSSRKNEEYTVEVDDGQAGTSYGCKKVNSSKSEKKNDRTKSCSKPKRQNAAYNTPSKSNWRRYALSSSSSSVSNSSSSSNDTSSLSSSSVTNSSSSSNDTSSSSSSSVTNSSSSSNDTSSSSSSNSSAVEEVSSVNICSVSMGATYCGNNINMDAVNINMNIRRRNVVCYDSDSSSSSYSSTSSDSY